MDGWRAGVPRVHGAGEHVVPQLDGVQPGRDAGGPDAARPVHRLSALATTRARPRARQAGGRMMTTTTTMMVGVERASEGRSASVRACVRARVGRGGRSM
eukprot:scaffold2321_cov329-Prasinococcus_capsulatus_cf.AAC.3